MTGTDPIRIFIGSGEASLLERKTLIYSLQQNSGRQLDISVFNGTHNSIERGSREPVSAGMPLQVKYRNFTEFSLYRFLIPELCANAGRAIWLDSDMLCLDEIGSLFDMDMEGCAIRCVPAYGPDSWATSVMLIDCAGVRFALEEILGQVDQGLFTLEQLLRLEPPFLRHYPLRVGPLAPCWNSFDACDPGTRILHFTNLSTQPWRVPGHAQAGLWHKYFAAARAAGCISDAEVRRALSLGYANREALCPAQVQVVAAPAAATSLRHLFRRLYRRIRNHG